MDIEQKDINRFKFLKYLYDKVDGSSSEPVEVFKTGEELGFDRTITSKIVEYLCNEYLIEYFAGSPDINITHSGVKEIEEALKNPEEQTEHFPPAINIININSMNNSVIQQGTNASFQSVEFREEIKKDIEQLIIELQKIKKNFNKHSNELTEFQSQLDTLKSQLKSPRPIPIIIKETLKSLRSLIEGVAAGAMTPQLTDRLSKLIELI